MWPKAATLALGWVAFGSLALFLFHHLVRRNRERRNGDRRSQERRKNQDRRKQGP